MMPSAALDASGHPNNRMLLRDQERPRISHRRASGAARHAPFSLQSQQVRLSGCLSSSSMIFQCFSSWRFLSAALAILVPDLAAAAVAPSVVITYHTQAVVRPAPASRRQRGKTSAVPHRDQGM